VPPVRDFLLSLLFRGRENALSPYFFRQTLFSPIKPFIGCGDEAAGWSHGTPPGEVSCQLPLQGGSNEWFAFFLLLFHSPFFFPPENTHAIRFFPSSGLAAQVNA